MTVYEYAKILFKDEEHNKGGIINNERKYLDKVGFEYTVKDGCISCVGEDGARFYDAMEILRELNKKYAN